MHKPDHSLILIKGHSRKCAWWISHFAQLKSKNTPNLNPCWEKIGSWYGICSYMVPVENWEISCHCNCHTWRLTSMVNSSSYILCFICVRNENISHKNAWGDHCLHILTQHDGHYHEIQRTHRGGSRICKKGGWDPKGGLGSWYNPKIAQK